MSALAKAQALAEEAEVKLRTIQAAREDDFTEVEILCTLANTFAGIAAATNPNNDLIAAIKKLAKL